MKQGWEIKKLGEVCTIGGGSTPSKTNKDFWENGAIPWFTIEDIREQGRKIRYTQKHITEKALNKTRLFPPKTTLLCCTASIGEYAISEVEITSNQQFNGIVVKDSGILNPYYIFYFAATLKEKLLKLSSKTTIDFVSTGKVKELTIPVPSLLEQGRIVGVLDAAFAKIDALKENAQKNLENAKTLFQQVLKQELTPKPNWQTKKLGEIALKKLSYGASVPSRNFDGEYRYIRITDIDEDGKLLNDLVSPAVCEEKHILHSGDLLLARTGGTIGKSYLYSPEDGKCIYAGYLIRVIVNQDIVLPEFVFFNTKTDRYWNFIKKSQKTAAQPNINAQQYSSFDIPYPSKDEQEGIVRKIKSIFTKQKQLEKCCQKTIAECDALKQAVLRRAFNGEL